MIRIKDTNQKNYLAKVVSLPKPRKHTNADRLQVVTIDFQSVITGMDAKEGDLCIYFPLECKINLDFLSHTNSFAKSELNVNKDTKGYFNEKGRVKATRLRGEKSMGYLVPCSIVSSFFDYDLSNHVGEEFDMINNIVVCEKYQVEQKKKRQQFKTGRKPQISRLIDGQFKLHVSTDNLRKNAEKLKLGDRISVSYKLHGTSAVFGNILTKKKLSLFQRGLKAIGVPVQDQEYDIVYSSRRVVKNEFETQNIDGFYSEDIWTIVKDEIKDLIPKGWTIYGEIVGYLPNGQMIQKGYDYGCKKGKHEFYVYRITKTNPDGFSIELSTHQIKEFCDLVGLKTPRLFFSGRVENKYNDLDYFVDHYLDSHSNWKEEFIENLERDYNEKDCIMCSNKVPEEGIVLRIENSLTHFEAYKLKSFSFLERETKELDKGVVSLEEIN